MLYMENTFPFFLSIYFQLLEWFRIHCLQEAFSNMLSKIRSSWCIFSWHPVLLFHTTYCDWNKKYKARLGQIIKSVMTSQKVHNYLLKNIIKMRHGMANYTDLMKTWFLLNGITHLKTSLKAELYLQKNTECIGLPYYISNNTFKRL